MASQPLDVAHRRLTEEPLVLPVLVSAIAGVVLCTANFLCMAVIIMSGGH